MRLALAGMGVLVACGGGNTAAPATVAVPPATTPTVVVHPTNSASDTSQSTDKRYTIADLRALAQQHAWSELIDHLEDVTPSTRDAEWASLAQQAALGVLASSTDHGPSAGLTTAHALLTRYPTLKD